MICTSPTILDRGIFRCGRCLSCLAAKKRDWSTRLMNEMQTNQSSIVVTLTYANEFLPENSSLSKRDFQLFMKRFRKNLGGRRIKYFCAGEYGDLFGRPHYHCIMYNVSLKDKELIAKSWNKGMIYVDLLTSKSINYVTKYIQKPKAFVGRDGRRLYLYEMKKEAPFRLMSQGIGLDWFFENITNLLQDKLIKWGDSFRPIPRYYRKMLMLDLSDFPLLIYKSYQEIKKMITKTFLTKAERDYVNKYEVKSYLTLQSVYKKYKNMLKTIDNDLRIRYDMNI
ncbi:replication initiator protein [Sigmofec virus UA08Rod_5625]|uniref:Replication initiator protein n=1 Tax=Sigmofec virus UA08Rod_5625 TaxID=2929432 RepID=A0A976N0Z2_9VIRU|nr:replication initiator protein [Sigmofec virus UA08Rod_5625]